MNQSSKYIFGPVPSRRLGLSLGIDIIPFKTCTLDCLYCEVGGTTTKTLHRKEYTPTDEVLTEVLNAVVAFSPIDYLTFSGSGEPTLHSGLGSMIKTLKKNTGIPVCVITNGTLLYLPDVRESLMEADVVIPSLDAVTEKVFAKINRPHPALLLTGMIEGMITFRKEYKGQLWLEILFCRGINDTDAEVQQIITAVGKINPDKIQLNTVVRPPAFRDAEPVEEMRLQEIASMFGNRCEIIGHYTKRDNREQHMPSRETALRLLRLRAMTVEGMAAAMRLPQESLEMLLQSMEREGTIVTFRFEKQQFFRAKEATPTQFS